MSRIQLLMQAGLLVCSVAFMPAAAQTTDDGAAPPPPAAATQPHAGAARFIARFQAANTTHDGRLTLAQAEAGRMPMVARNFDAIDVQHKGYVTLQDIRAWRRQARAERGAANAPNE